MNDEENQNIERITSGVIAYLKFLKNFKKIHEDYVISKEGNNTFDFTYIFREFNVECYIIDKKYLDDFRTKIDFEDLISLLRPIESVNEEKINKFKERLKKNLEKNTYKYEEDNFNVYSELEEMKKVVKNLNNYSFVCKELLCDAMGVPEINLKDKMFKVSKNKNDTCLISISNNFTLNINVKKKLEENKNKQEIKEYKALYYVEDITKRIFTLLYFFNENSIQNKIKKEIKDVYDFQTYYLIDKNWLNEYKSFFLYDSIINKLTKIVDKNGIYTYKKARYHLDDIIKKLGQIKISTDSTVDNYIRNSQNLIPKFKRRRIARKAQDEQETPDLIDYFTPNEFCIINKDIFELLEKEEFFYNMNDTIKKTIKFEILIGNGKIIIKNKKMDNKEQKINEKLNYSNEYLIYVDNKRIKFENEDDPEKNESFILYYILYYFKKNELFFENLKIINKKNGLKEFTKNLDINKTNAEQNIKDGKGNILGNFINFRIINEDEDIKNDNNDSNNNDNINSDSNSNNDNIKENDSNINKKNNEYNSKGDNIDINNNDYNTDIIRSTKSISSMDNKGNNSGKIITNDSEYYSYGNNKINDYSFHNNYDNDNIKSINYSNNFNCNQIVKNIDINFSRNDTINIKEANEKYNSIIKMIKKKDILNI